MGIRNGQQFIKRINEMQNDIWFDGKRVEGNISEHPAFKGVLKSKAALYDLQHDPKLQPSLTFWAPDLKEHVGLSYLAPKSKEDLVKRRNMMELWAKHTNGMMGRSPDYINSVIMSFATAASSLENKENCFPENIRNLYQHAMKNDLSFSHTFVSPQVNRAQFHLDDSNEPIAAQIVDKTAEGIIVKGARLLATQGGITDEVLVLSVPKLLLEKEEVFAFAIPSNTEGLQFICRDSFVGGKSDIDHPLSSKYEEMDCLVVFNNVLVPWNRVFYYEDPEIVQSFMQQCAFGNFTIYQALTRQIVKTEFILGLAELLAQTINVRGYPHIQEKISEIIIGLESIKALIEKAENDASLDAFGIMRPAITPLKVASNLFPKLYPRFTEILQLIGASGMISLPSENALHSPIRPAIDQYLQGAFIPAEERIKIFRLAWDLTMSTFGTRQTQYERFFYGDSVRLASELYQAYDRSRYVKRVEEFIRRIQ